MKARWLLATLLAAPLAVTPAHAAGEVGVARDTTLRGFLGRLADSTDAYFGISAAPPDTAGLDTVIFDSASRPTRRLTLRPAPTFDFNRVDGSTPGLSVALEAEAPPGRTGWGRLRGGIARANGPRVVMGGATYANRLWLAGQPLDLRLWGGRATAPLDRDDSEGGLTLVRALVLGNDWTQYLRSDGLEGSLAHAQEGWRAAVGYRDLLQSPRHTTATWNLTGRDLEMPGNLAASRGRVRELEYTAALRWPRLPLRTEITYQTSSRRLGSAFEYRRVRAAAGLDLPLGRFASLVPQFAWGRLTGEALPQASFYLGGGGTLRSLHRDERGGTGMTLAKLDLIGTQDLLALLRLPHPAALPLQGALFAAGGALWGRDPWTGAIARGGDWPDQRDWRGEAGVSLLYSSLLFPRGATLRCSHAWALGPGAGGGRWSISFTRPLDLLGPEPAEE